MSEQTKPKYTPGPWDKIKHGEHESKVGATTLIAVVYSTAFKDQENQRANANLIAAAPDLLETLKACLALFAKDHALDRFDWGKSALRAEDIRELNELPSAIRRAIFKAEGSN